MTEAVHSRHFRPDVAGAHPAELRDAIRTLNSPRTQNVLNDQVAKESESDQN
ncbi:MAG: hypothetical protein ABW189_06400 [Rickettsiales bacterium]